MSSTALVANVNSVYVSGSIFGRTMWPYALQGARSVPFQTSNHRHRDRACAAPHALVVSCVVRMQRGHLMLLGYRLDIDLGDFCALHNAVQPYLDVCRQEVSA